MVLSKDMKIAICFGLICGAIISICNLCFAAEREEITPQVLNNARVGSDGVISATDSYQLDFAEIEPGYIYYIVNTSSGSKRVGLCNDISIGSQVSSLVNLAKDEEFSFNGSVGYIYCCGTDSSSDSVKFYRVKLEGLPSFVDNIAYSLSYVNLNNIVANVVPILAIGVLLALGFYLLKRLLNRIKRAKGGV